MLFPSCAFVAPPTPFSHEGSLREQVFCFLVYVFKGGTTKIARSELVGLFRILRMAKLARLHHFRHMWRYC